MAGILKFKSISEYNAFNKHDTKHPLISVVDLSKADPRKARVMSYNFYTIFLKQVVCGDLRYGRHNYDYQEGTLVFLAPGQVIGQDGEEYYQPQGIALVFHPDLLPGTALARHMSDYAFFSYEVHEALHLSSDERQIIIDCLSKIDFELKRGVDKHSKKLIVANISLFLDYCVRFYDRQFITRDNVHKSLIQKFESLLNDYFKSNEPQNQGLPTVRYCAEQLNLSSNYFSDLLKKETGKSAQEYIHLKVIELAKELIFNPEKSVREIAFELGFKYPQHFTRLFKQKVGQTPNEYRMMN